jgi:hypothetical protein
MVEQNDFSCAIKARKSMSNTVRDEKKALASYYGGETLYNWIAPFSKKEDGAKQLWRATRTIDHYSNYVKEISQAYLDGIYRKNSVKRVTSIDALDNYLNTTYDTYFKNDIALMQLLIPECFIYICHQEIEMAIETEQDKMDMKAWAMPEVVLGSNVLNYELC